jgi:hypothetical protein
MKLRYVGDVAVLRQGARVVCYKHGSVSLLNGECSVSGKLAAELLSRDDYQEIDESKKRKAEAAPVVKEVAPVKEAAPAKEAAPVKEAAPAKESTSRKKRPAARKKTSK